MSSSFHKKICAPALIVLLIFPFAVFADEDRGAIIKRAERFIALAGFVNLTGWPDRNPVMTWGAYTDFIAARYAIIALLAALCHRHKTGEGTHLDISQYECCIPFLVPLLLEFSCNSNIRSRNANRCDYAAPHGVYPCRDEDSWCGIAIFTDLEWDRLCRVMGNESLAKHSKLATLTQRKVNEDELDRLASSLSKTPASVDKPAPCLGQHNHYVYTNILKGTDEDFLRLSAEGVFE